MTAALQVSFHAGQRMQQRGIRPEDITLILACGTQVDADSILLTDKAAARAVQARKREIQALERLRGTKVVVSENVVVTCYQVARKRIKQALRRSH